MDKKLKAVILTYPNKNVQFNMMDVVDDLIKVVEEQMPVAVIQERVKLAQELDQIVETESEGSSQISYITKAQLSPISP